MNWLVYLTVALVLTWGLDRVAGTKILLGVLLLLDCLGNLICGGSFNQTLSARAHFERDRQQPYWGWTAGVIDRLFFFDHDHCHRQFLREQAAGGAWGAYRAS